MIEELAPLSVLVDPHLGVVGSNAAPPRNEARAPLFSDRTPITRDVAVPAATEVSALQASSALIRGSLGGSRMTTRADLETSREKGYD